MDRNYLIPEEITDYTIRAGVKKANRTVFQQLMLSILAGAFIAMGAIASNTAIHDISNPGISKLVAGAIFPVGLLMVVIAGAELFTGNCLLSLALFEEKISLYQMIKNLFIVYAGNFIGSLGFAWLEANSGLFDLNSGKLGALHIKTAIYKTGLSFSKALILGIMCNVIVCIAVWMMYGAKDLSGKVWAGFFPIFAFVISGYEHSVANMYYIPAGLFAKSNPLYVKAGGFASEALAGLTWKSFIITNLLPVTIGNIIGGALFVGGIYWLIFKKKINPQTSIQKNG